MTDAIVWSNVVFTAGALVLALIICLILVLRHRTPRTVEATVDSFTRGLQALAPQAQTGRRRRRRHAAQVARPADPSNVRTTYPSRGRTGGMTREADTG